MQLQNFIEMAREIIETATTADTLHGRLKGLGMDWAGTFPNIPMEEHGRCVTWDGYGSVWLNAGAMGVEIKLLAGDTLVHHTPVVFTHVLDVNAYAEIKLQLVFGVYVDGTWYPSNQSLIYGADDARKYLEFF